MFLYSIIIPVFNVENYLRGCLDSIFKQSFKDFELILVNDGSTDSSGQICKEYAQRNENIIYIEQDNQGVAAAFSYSISNVFWVLLCVIYVYNRDKIKVSVF